jgi:tRNA 5-methylaminomethyl-2-thiouridine biosynthesis bifunctional protein
MFPTALVPARFTDNGDGALRSPEYDDIYHAAAGALAQCRHVFLDGNRLPERWRARDRFTVIETGFGSGLNFLATWVAWRDDPARCGRLAFVSVEKHPFSGEDLRAIHRRWPELAALSQQLLEAWPPPVPGFHRLNLDDDRVGLTLLFGDAPVVLPQLRAQADAFYLDGFAPSKNPAMWSPAVFRQVGRLAAEGATAATWSVAAIVRDGLREAGFACKRQPGFADKREMLVARRERKAAAPFAEAPARHAIVVGAGLAGSSCATSLAARGWQVDLLERHAAAAQEASGNLAGVLRPLLSLDDNRLSRLTRAGFLLAVRHLQQLERAGLGPRWQACGVLQLARDARHEATPRATIARHGYPADFARFVERELATQLVGHPAAAGGWHFPGGGWVNPPSLVAANLARGGARIDLRAAMPVVSLQRHGDLWRALAGDGSVIAEAARVILATGCGALPVAGAMHLPLRAGRGQVSLLPARGRRAMNCVVTQRGYATPALDGWHCAGATFDADDDSLSLAAADHAENLVRLEAMLPGFADPTEVRMLAGRVGFRPTSPDKRPLIGALPCARPADAREPGALWRVGRLPGIIVANGFGARGLVWSTLAGELIAAGLEGEPLPLEADLVVALDPARFLLRQHAPVAGQSA